MKVTTIPAPTRRRRIAGETARWRRMLRAPHHMPQRVILGTPADVDLSAFPSALSNTMWVLPREER